MVGWPTMAAGRLLLFVALIPSAGSRGTTAVPRGCRDRISGCQELIDSGARSCAIDFCESCGNQRRRCDATCGFCKGDAGDSRAAATAAILAATATREHRAAAPPVMPAVRSCYMTKLAEPTIREHRCEGAAEGANSCFINLALRLAGCCFAPGTAPADRPALECSAENDGRICHARACNTPVPMQQPQSQPPLAPLVATAVTGTYTDPNHPQGYREVVVSPDGAIAVSGSDHAARGAEWTLRGRLVDAESVLIDFSPKAPAVGTVTARFDGSGLVFPDGNKWLKVEDAGPVVAAAAPAKKLLPPPPPPPPQPQPQPPQNLNWHDETGPADDDSPSPLKLVLMVFSGVLVARCLCIKAWRWKRRRDTATMLPMKMEAHVH
jgi:hypothetical protein